MIVRALVATTLVGAARPTAAGGDPRGLTQDRPRGVKLAIPEFDAALDFDGPPSSAQVGLGRRVLRRVINDRLRAHHSNADGEFEVFCECGRAGCRDGVRDTILIAPELYEKVRSSPAHFLIKPSHAGGERIVDVAAGLLVVEEVGAIVKRVGVGHVSA